MKVTSLGWRTDLALLRLSGSTVEDRPDRIVVRTPANPSYFWGNFVLFATLPPAAEAVAAFVEEFPDSDHVAIGANDPDLGTRGRQAFGELGVEVDDCVVLTAGSLVTPPTVGATVRPLASAADWEARVRLGLAVNEGGEVEAFADFERRKGAMERSLVERGLGHRYGVLEGDEVVATAACFDCGDGVWRYQAVETRPDRRRRGYAAAVVAAAGQAALEAGARTLVIVADADGDAVRIYRRLGLVDSERQLMLERRGGAWAVRSEA